MYGFVSYDKLRTNGFIRKGSAMAIKLNKVGFDNAAAIIKNGLEVEHDTKWESVKPTRDEQARFIETHDLDEYGSWFLGIDADKDPKSITKFVFPFGDFSVLHKSALIVAEKEATKLNAAEIKAAAQKLLDMIKQQAR